MSGTASLAVLHAHAAAFIAERGRMRELAERREAQIRTLYMNGWSKARIALHVSMAVPTVARRIKEMNLPERPPRGWRRETVGLSIAQMQAYRLYRRKGFDVAEARQAALRAEAA